MATGDLRGLKENAGGTLDEVVSLQATSAELLTGTEISKVATPKNLKDSKYRLIEIGTSAPASGEELWFDTTGVPATITVNEAISIACSDVTSNLTTGEKARFDIPYNFILTRVFASVATAPTGSALTIDVEDEGTSILNAVLSIAASANNAETSTFASAASTYTFTKGDLITIDIDQIGSTVSGAGLIVFLEGYKT